MEKFVSIMTSTFASEISYNEWYKLVNEFFASDDKITNILKDKGMIKWAIYKTDDVEPVKAVTIFEYKTKDSFQKCQKVFIKFMPKVGNMIIKVNIVRGKTVFDKI